MSANGKLVHNAFTIKFSGRVLRIVTDIDVAPVFDVNQSPAPQLAGQSNTGKALPISKDDCPASHPIKGNQGSRSTDTWIYHMPGGGSYAVTDPEECFSTEAAAQAAGYRKALR